MFQEEEGSAQIAKTRLKNEFSGGNDEAELKRIKADIASTAKSGLPLGEKRTIIDELVAKDSKVYDSFLYKLSRKFHKAIRKKYNPPPKSTP